MKSVRNEIIRIVKSNLFLFSSFFSFVLCVLSYVKVLNINYTYYSQVFQIQLNLEYFEKYYSISLNVIVFLF